MPYLIQVLKPRCELFLSLLLYKILVGGNRLIFLKLDF